jgi:hypothetical protein
MKLIDVLKKEKSESLRIADIFKGKKEESSVKPLDQKNEKAEKLEKRKLTFEEARKMKEVLLYLKEKLLQTDLDPFERRTAFAIIDDLAGRNRILDIHIHSIIPILEENIKKEYAYKEDLENYLKSIKSQLSYLDKNLKIF